MLLTLFLILSASASEPATVGLRYVKLIDRGGYVDSHSSPGADVDAVALLRADQPVAWATRVVASSIGTGSFGNEVANPSKALGPADHPPSTLDGFVALGGAGHFVVLELGEVTRAGDQLQVHEVGRVGGRAEPIEVCVSASPDGPWRSVGMGWGLFTVPLWTDVVDPESHCTSKKLS